VQDDIKPNSGCVDFMKKMPQQHGFAAIAAIFLVVVLAALGGFMLTFSNTQQLTAAQDLQGVRAYWAARTGLEWGIGSVAASTATPPACPVLPAPATTSSAPTSSTTPLTTSFDGGFTVTVNCVRTDYEEAPATSGTANRFLYQFISVASTPGAAGSIGFVERSISASMECVKNGVVPVYSCG
jgi:MSHA biogenesis protein MshP